MNIIKNKKPDLKLPVFSVDGELHKKLNEYEITRLLNKHTFTMFLGKAGSGKSSLMISLLNTGELFKKVFNHIFYFCPKNSQASMKDNVFEKNLAEDKIFDELTVASLETVYHRCMDNATEGENNLIILDDMQASLKNIDVQKYLLHIVSNRRHARTSIWLLSQNFLLCPAQIRQSLTDMFIFKVSKREVVNIFEQVFESPKEKFDIVLSLAWKRPHSFLYINTETQRIFLDWDELVFTDSC
jgi:hypothetical protein